jgi:hydroxymethylbilane synthase
MTAPFAPRRLTIATRESALALWQAEHVRAQLTAQFRGTSVELLGITTQGDRVLDRPLATIGGKGLFIKELETALREGRADLAVHSLKDVPMDVPDGFVLAAISAREDARDAFVSNEHESLAAMPAGAVVGTSSLRREAQLRERFPHLAIEPLRGNVHTRLRKLDDSGYGAIILAAAGLKRLGLGTRIRCLLDPDDSLPAPGQGALAIETRVGDCDAPWIQAIKHHGTTVAVAAERGALAALEGSCKTAIGAHAWFEGARLKLIVEALAPDGSVRFRHSGEADLTELVDAEASARALGVSLGLAVREEAGDAIEI